MFLRVVKVINVVWSVSFVHHCYMKWVRCSCVAGKTSGYLWLSTGM